MILIKAFLVAAIIGMLWLGFYLVTRYHKLFGPHPDDPSETPGARSFGLAHIISIWIGTLGLLIYFLFKSQ